MSAIVQAADLPPLAVQQSDISSSLNATIIFTFMIGIYTVVYIGTLYLYLTKRSSQRLVIVGTITMLYLLSIVQFGFQLWDLQWTFLKHGETRESVFVSQFTSPAWGEILSTTSTVLTLVLADGLLIWRCFFVWNRSLRVILLPLFLLFAEAVISIIILGIDFQHPTSKISALFGGLESALYFVSVATSLTGTVLIAFRIHSVSSNDSEGVLSLERFKDIIEIVVQSAVLYSLALLVPAIGNIVPPNIPFANYSGAICSPIKGLAPTIMVARVCTANANNSTSQPSTIHRISGLQFQGEGTNDNETRTGTDSLREMNGDVIPISLANQQIKAFRAKDQ
ncbi:hypothetical protein GALMADRAFT_918004 [Galerina marginata CBS 339.88]|uniref:Uncharacterized protein n=1 Tax=Galerina marginata (strain CBS 339.88) TaxID=685588 RepID=A0A067SFG6_GALM3|nr:hypothetical protein GALMADRAFT_918004 [Galerina marginata CBS 339.88]